eukprot:TRINITY_DN1693_c0_g1_i1.p1 TRINITY_DN1693_c0_g1~~TRINITY_DN1693_c0_g1_i1.p1  ORF type:complete len:409 (-),score=108.34 TRINITY_DN1693_c0_g1_i1:96-1322(-)
MIQGVYLVLLAISGCFCQDDFATLQEMLDHNVERYKLIGVDVGAFSANGEWLLRGQSGERVYQEGTPISDKDMFIMGSAGKSMTSTMAARVVAQGFINWNTTTKEIFHDTGLFDVHESYWPSTLEQFISHGSGAPGLDVVVDEYYDMVDYIFNKTSWEADFDNRPARVFLSKTLLENEVTVPQGTYLYSIGGFTVAGTMLELATGKTYEQLMMEELFEPLGMDGCGFGPTTTDPSLPPVQPWGHLGDQWGVNIAAVTPGPYANVASPMIPDGGLHCNLDSWNNYLAMHLREDEDFLPKDIWEYIHNPITQNFYGFGWMFDSSNPLTGKTLNHGGTDGHNFAQCFLIPRFGVGINIGLNQAGVMSQGSLQGAGFGKVLEWVGTHMLGKEIGAELRKIAEDTMYDDSLPH